MNSRLRPLLLTTFMLLAGTAAHAENWPQFRGPRGDGTSHESGVPVRWSPTENIRWKSALPGEGHSSPIVWNGAVFLTTADKTSGARHLLRLDAATGKIVWQVKVVAAPVEAMHRENSAASSTPATDGAHVFTSFQAGDRVDVRCFDFAGRQVWAVQPLAFDGEHGYSYSPVLHGEHLILDCRQEGEAAVLAFDKRTGRIVWRAAPGRKRISHATPLLIATDAGTQLVVCGSDEIRSYDPATGRPIWWCEGPSEVGVSGMAFGDGLLFASSGYPTRTRLAVRVDGRGEITGSHVAWRMQRQAPYVPSPVFHAGNLYSVDDGGMLYCFEAKTGEPRWERRLGGRTRSSLVLADGHLYSTNEKGVTFVVAVDPVAFRLVATNTLGEFCYTTPAISGGRLFLRTGKHLFCIGAEAGR
jgi:outer membrane protein assembly factor BamB